MKKFLLLLLLLSFVGKISYAQLQVSDIDQGYNPGSYEPSYGHYSFGYAMIQTTNALPPDGVISLIAVTATGYTGGNSYFLGYNENDEPTAGYFADISDYQLNFSAYDYVEVLYEMLYTDNAGTHYFKHLVTYVYDPH
jgi:hypothetical protein